MQIRLAQQQLLTFLSTLYMGCSSALLAISEDHEVSWLHLTGGGCPLLAELARPANSD